MFEKIRLVSRVVKLNRERICRSTVHRWRGFKFVARMRELFQEKRNGLEPIPIVPTADWFLRSPCGVRNRQSSRAIKYK